MNTEENYIQQLNELKDISEQFIGSKVTLFGYVRGFYDLYISFKLSQKEFLLKLMFTHYVKVLPSWIFQGFKIEIISAKQPLLCKISDRDYFESITSLCGFYTRILTEEERESELNNHTNIQENIPRVLVDIDSKTKTIADYFTLPSPIHNTVSVHRYDRWNKILFLKFGEYPTYYLVLYNCELLEFHTGLGFNLQKTMIYQESENLVIKEKEGDFFAQCKNVEIWNRDKFFEYDMDLYEQFGATKGFGTRNLITSVDEMGIDTRA
jgi:hypothetical protein